eukprot:scaffold77399_cov76-Phaeocystis_antarctica.AAC.9
MRRAPRRSLHEHALLHERACMVKGGGIGGFGGGWLEHPRRAGALPRSGLCGTVLACPEPPGAP